MFLPVRMPRFKWQKFEQQHAASAMKKHADDAGGRNQH